METDLTHRLCLLLHSVVGHSYDNDSNLKVLCDLEGGKLLLDWLTSQVSTNLTEEYTADEERVASLRDILLEEEEMSILNTIDSSANNYTKPIIVAPSDYMLPSQSKKHANYIRNETQVIQCEANELRMKISQTKNERKRSTRTLKLLRSIAGSLASVITESNEALSELSIGVDATITSTVNSAHGLLCAYECYLRPSPSGAVEHMEMGVSGQAPLKMIQARLFGVTKNLQTYLTRYYELRKKELRRLQDLNYEAKRLSNTLKSTHIGMLAQEIPDSEQSQALLQELIDISGILQSQLSSNPQYSFDRFAKSLVPIDSDEEIDPHPFGTTDANSVNENIIGAWKKDQLSIIRCHEEELYDVSSSLNFALSLLQSLHNSILQVIHFTRDAESTLQTLREELAEIDTEASIGNKNQTRLDMEDELQHELKLALTYCTRNGSPTLLLDKEDILVQLRLLKSKAENSERSHRYWATNVIADCSLRPVHPLLPGIYSQSTLNSCPPFEFSANTRELETETRTRMKQLHTLSKSLEEEVQGTFSKDDHWKRLKGFVDRWTLSRAGVA
ncbi:hypothetical protein JR316_0003374 [Psilocybe cubensis]|uniref:Uncharacterized protein n=2 Tax=Psilocybe cubensis TaxID=181762 RepID=A0A8H8CMX9_PSICU|nr:hypothetical protein JR316_0003374 [Psilocybe cubensis]KAH9483896.1 hypothetical protein JR316_0003374 [Psilocybe cubensis]